MSLGGDYSNKHREVFKRDFKVAISSMENYIEEIEEYGDETNSGVAFNREEFANDIEVHGEGEDVSVSASRPEFGKVFISHSSEDAHYVEDLVECLEIVGLPRCLRCLLLVMCTYPCAKKALTLHLARGEGRERYFGCNLMQRKVLASSHQHLMAEAPKTECS